MMTASKKSDGLEVRHPSSAQILGKIEFIRVVLILQLGQPQSFPQSDAVLALEKNKATTSVVSCLKPQDVCHLDMNYDQRSLTFVWVSGLHPYILLANYDQQ